MMRGMLREASQLLEHLQALRPELSFLEHIGEQSEERVGLRTLLGLAQRLRGVEEHLDVAGIALDLIHPERLEIVELFLLDQSTRIFAERHGSGIVFKTVGGRQSAAAPLAVGRRDGKNKKPGFMPGLRYCRPPTADRRLVTGASSRAS